jgi:hypothetical protein
MPYIILMAPPRQAITKERLLSRIKEIPGRLDTPCWEWQGTRHTFGYGVLQEGGAKKPKKYLAHRCSYRLFKGDLPDEIDVLHRCDNPPCINPDHLFSGTRGENCTDCAQKDRHARGMRHGLAKLTDENVIKIRNSSEYARIVAPQYGVCEATIYFIRQGKTWRHLK